jgi:quercetin dioxygenase-like cupin family protein
MVLKRGGSRPVQKGPLEWFTGEVTIEALSNPPAPSRIGVASVTFQPGARTAWHTHR